MGKHSKDKGARGEREVVNLLEQMGHEADRLGHAQASPKIKLPDVVAYNKNGASIAIEVKLREKLPKYIKPSDKVDCVFVREDRGEWLVVVKLSKLIEVADKLAHRG